jgi:hypothetical protein
MKTSEIRTTTLLYLYTHNQDDKLPSTNAPIFSVNKFFLEKLIIKVGIFHSPK